jgi:hypothetical protein
VLVMRTYRAFNVQLDPKIWEALATVAELGGMTKKQAIEAMIANAAGQPWKGADTVKTAWARYRRQGWWNDNQHRITP